MNQIELSLSYADFPISRKTPQIAEVLLCASLERILKGLSCEFFVRRRTLRIDRESGRLVMIPAHSKMYVRLNPLNNLVRIWSVVYKVADAPQCIVVALGERFERCQISMNVRDDDDLHRASIPGMLDDHIPCITFGISGSRLLSRRLPDENFVRGHHPPTRISIRRDGAAVWANPFALGIQSIRTLNLAYQISGLLSDADILATKNSQP
jgi:hypothetical protein